MDRDPSGLLGLLLRPIDQGLKKVPGLGAGDPVPVAAITTMQDAVAVSISGSNNSSARLRFCSAPTRQGANVVSMS